jgi:2-polyprenyl-3-methyl-5-hydroxy-6-metoxy-1,4-benzoquinol methylase
VNEAILEPVLRRMRIGQVLPIIQQYHDCILLDIGCGWEAKFLRSVEAYVSKGEGIDSRAPDLRTERLSTRRITLTDTLPYPNEAFDVVTMLAVLEHLSHPKAVVAEVSRILKPGGRLVLTVPSKAAKPVLEFLAFRLGVVSAAEIRDHKCYYTRRLLRHLVSGTGLVIEAHRYFQLGMNNFAVCGKQGIAQESESVTFVPF